MLLLQNTSLVKKDVLFSFYRLGLLFVRQANVEVTLPFLPSQLTRDDKDDFTITILAIVTMMIMMMITRSESYMLLILIFIFLHLAIGWLRTGIQ